MASRLQRRQTSRSRDPEATRERLVAAVGSLLAREGFSSLGINAVAREARVDKVLIYRYFDGVEGLLEAFGRSESFWPDFDELAGDVEVLSALTPAERLSTLLRRYARTIRRRPLTQEILAWETVERNPLTAVLEGVRERLSLELLRAFAPEGAPGDIDISAVSAVFGAAINYLVIRARTVRVFNGVEISTEAGWERIERAIDRMCTGLVDSAGNG